MKKILIWGTGKLAKQFIENGFNGEVIGFIESTKTKESFFQKPVYGIDEIPKDYEYIIVANSYVSEIYNLCCELDIDTSKLIFLFGIKNRIGCTELSILKELLSEKNYNNYCIEFNLRDKTFFKTDAIKYQRLNQRENFKIYEKYMWPIIGEKCIENGAMGNYFWQDLWAAKKIIKSRVKEHYDIGSRVDGFIAHLLAADIRVNVIDIRPFPSQVDNLYTIVDDATMLEQFEDDSVSSMSALCSLEHFGLGRYGDPIDPEACFKCFDNMQKKLKKGGRLYISLPIGKERVEFNAHRVFYASTVEECFKNLKLEEFSCTAEGRIEYHVDIHKYDNDPHNGEYRYGLFYFVK